MSPYEYQKLSTTSSIRLLRIEKASVPTGCQIPPSQDAIELTLSLSAFPLNEAPEFDALSYTWGNPMVPYSKYYSPEYSSIPSIEVEINGQSLLITQSLATALARIHHVNLDHHGCDAKSEYLWADGICINQDDLDERSSQVVQMGSIFAQAAKVLIWLGEEDEFTEDGITTLEMLAKIDPSKYDAIGYTDWEIRTTVLRDKGLVDWTSTWEHWLGLETLLNRPWFRRVWVIQEAVVNDTNIVLCGQRVLPWKLFSGPLRFLASTGWGKTDYGNHYQAVIKGAPWFSSKIRRYADMLRRKQLGRSTLCATALMLEDTRDEWREQQRQGVALWWLLTRIRLSSASDLRDKIYALVGLVNSIEEPRSILSAILTPDYRLPVEVLYVRTTRVILEAFGNLKWLREAGPPERGALPSWAADYSALLWQSGFANLSGTDDYYSKFNASGEARWQVVPASVDQMQLEVQGVWVDSVTTVPEVPRDTTMPHDIPDRLAAAISLAATVGNVQLSIASSKSRFEVFWRTVTADFQAGQDPGPPSPIGERMLECLAYIVQHNGRNSLLTSDTLSRNVMRILEADNTDPSVTSKDLKAPGRFLAAILRCRKPEISQFLDHRIFRAIDANMSTPRWVALTAEGRFITCPDYTKPGDEIWILAGSPVPVVLRKTSNTEKGLDCYEYVGQAYVYGIMHGEAMAGSPALTSIFLV
ncbi:heterokaryon incompatibility protein-domain-containing protein [Cercophora newfieldiana]|uniref:Heterokaryon incompatibility protein-domain-containing protein n=1 Tax=Cercophora newfieldiana TaxID=92897 RepID=A0AA40CT23_9PEZI|nr:heterokaryon incompatibility protein-domain-containing protein [Cercophora newfieldiana]